MQKNKLIVRLLAVTMVYFTMLVLMAAQKNDYITREAVADMLLVAADDYNPGLKKADILKVDGAKGLREKELATKVEAMAMLSRAFGKLEAPVGKDKRVALPDVDFKDVKAWAKADIKNLTQAGLLAGTSADKLGADEKVTAAQMDLMIRRVFTYKGSNVKDDFYATMNKSWMDSSKIPSGEMSKSIMVDMNNNNNEIIAKLFKDVVGAKSAKGTKEQKVADYYTGALKVYEGKVNDVSPLKPYFKAIDDAKSLDDLVKVRTKIRNELGMGTLIFDSVTENLLDSNKYIIEISGTDPEMQKEYYEAGDEVKENFNKYTETVLILAGETKAQAAKNAELIYNMQKALVKDALNAEDQTNIEKINNIFTLDQLQKLIPNIDLKAMLKNDGFTLPSTVVVADTGMFKAYATYLNNENLPVLKATMKKSLMLRRGAALSSEMNKATEQFQQVFFGIEGETSPADKATTETRNTMYNYLGQMFVEVAFSKEAKQDVTNMINEFLKVYEKRLKSVEWLSEETKVKAVSKLKNLTIKVGYPDVWEDSLKNVDITDSMYANNIAIGKAHFAKAVAKLNQKVDKTLWGMPVYEVNAFYNPSANEIVFPAGILQAPMYDKNNSFEKNLGGVGFIIAHEITHAFDNVGSKFDEKGNGNDWWKPEDYKRFEEKCKEIEKYYSGIETAPGIANNGARTIGENIADLGSMACILDTAKGMKNPNYKELFESIATSWASTYNRSILEFIGNMDVHSFDSIRCNRTMQSYEEFYKTFGVVQGDGMYLAPKDRVVIW